MAACLGHVRVGAHSNVLRWTAEHIAALMPSYPALGSLGVLVVLCTGVLAHRAAALSQEDLYKDLKLQRIVPGIVLATAPFSLRYRTGAGHKPRPRPRPYFVLKTSGYTQRPAQEAAHFPRGGFRWASVHAA